MKKLISMLCTAVLVVTPMTHAMAESNKGSTIEVQANKIATEMVQNYGVTGLQYAIRDEGKIILSDSVGFHDKASQKPVDKDTMFGIGSVSKMVVTAATMMLVDSGKIDLDQPLTSYIKDFEMADARYTQITPRMLMNHSSGLYGTHYGNSMLFNDNDTRNHNELLLKLKSEKLKSKPGAYSVYCNDGFQLLEILVERVSGLSYSEYIAKFISNPLQLEATKTPLDSFDRDRLSETYWPTIETKLPIENANIIGTGGIYSTAEELSQFAEVLMGNRPDILSKSSAESMQNHEYRHGIWVSEERNTLNYGLGWDAVALAPFSDYGVTALSKGGDTMLYHASLITIPEHDISMAVLSSGGSSTYNQMFASKVLLEVLEDQGIIEKIKPDQTFSAPVKVKMPTELTAYSGLYGTVGTTLNIDIKNSEFKLPALQGGLIPEQGYVYTGEGKFTSPDGSVEVRFEKERNDKVYVKVQSNITFPGLGQTEMNTYNYQKLEQNPLEAITKAKWEARNGSKYYALDEKITSIFYLLPSMLIKNLSVDTENGYTNGTKVIDPNNAKNVVEIPVMNGRDAFDLQLYTKNGAEVLIQDGQEYIAEDAITPIFAGKTGVTTIPSNGQARWYAIDSRSANKSLTVDSPESGGYAVYNDKGEVVHFSVATNQQSTQLPKGGFIVFGGEVGDVFKIQLK
ncbi:MULTISPECIES: serine hydrolase domain-containing protein [unclassified Paenibacillus]|uniref:serine hydrolase domain-containing protein n=1 Tax=unclassified Paenibacillus TaxID=185978 RepID=UPI00041526C5|nr:MULTISPECIES: serine hydrolase domain-containing protein [unclassified Paenibacillus]KGP78792.1 beta-lactamase [Paenibacillus sp. MAEPY2]KGP88728.1 beta-lactamase [Paenibacillus sp. MAEPY1]